MVHRTIIYRPLPFEHRSAPAPAGDDEAQLNFILALVLGLILLVVLFVVGVAVVHTRAKSAVADRPPVARHAMCNVCMPAVPVVDGLIMNTSD